MGINRDIGALTPELAVCVKLFLYRCKEKGIKVIVIETDRNQLVQNAYYAQGRESLEEVNRLRAIAGLYPITAKENKIITNAKVSNHTGGGAIDIGPERPDKPGYVWWDAPQEVWEEIGALAETCGLDWCAGGFGQTWGKGWDNPHYELMKAA